MRPNKAVTREAILQYLPQLEAREMTRAQLAKALGICKQTLGKRLKEFDLTLPKVRKDGPLRERLLQKYTAQQLSEISQTKLAKEFQVAQPYVSAELKALGIKSTCLNTITANTEERCEAVLAHLSDNGGSVKDAVVALGFHPSFRVTVYKYAKKVGFDIQHYRFAFRSYGHWTTLPGPVRRFTTSDYLLPARCELCGTEHTVSLINMKTGASTCCKSCSSKTQGTPRKVRCTETGEVFSSIRSWSNEIGQLKHYLRLRLRLLKDLRVTHGGLTYELVS